MEIPYTLFTIEDLRLSARYGEKFRGFFANKYPELDILHNHTKNRTIYRYPLVQYKIIKQIPNIIGLGEGAKLVYQLGLKEETFQLDEKEYVTYQSKLQHQKVDIGVINEYMNYEFITPWIALNQKNVQLYQKENSIEREKILQRILVGNILSFSKTMGYTVDQEIYIWINLIPLEVQFKNMTMIGFIGEYKVNFILPDFIGLGKSVSRGFGTICRKGG